MHSTFNFCKSPLWGFKRLTSTPTLTAINVCHLRTHKSTFAFLPFFLLHSALWRLVYPHVSRIQCRSVLIRFIRQAVNGTGREGTASSCSFLSHLMNYLISNPNWWCLVSCMAFGKWRNSFWAFGWYTSYWMVLVRTLAWWVNILRSVTNVRNRHLANNHLISILKFFRIIIKKSSRTS
jgi:hypothetical protein